MDRPKAPQSVIAVVREGVSAGDPVAPRLNLINTPLGGSFSSRLNQNLREEKHWAYGATSRFVRPRGQGMFMAMASVETAATGPALKEMLRELQLMAKEGITAAELDKAKAQDRADLLENFETISRTGGRLAMLAGFGLSPTFDVEATRIRQDQKIEDVASLAKLHVDPATATIVVVGPKDAVWSDLVGLGWGEPVLWDADGKPAAAAPVVKDKPQDKPKGK